MTGNVMFSALLVYIIKADRIGNNKFEGYTCNAHTDIPVNLMYIS